MRISPQTEHVRGLWWSRELFSVWCWIMWTGSNPPSSPPAIIFPPVSSQIIPPPLLSGGGGGEFLVLEEMIYGSAFKIADKLRVCSNTTLTSRTLLFQTSVKKLKNLKNDILIIQNTSTVQCTISIDILYLNVLNENKIDQCNLKELLNISRQ